MNRHSSLLWISCLVLGWLFDLLFWKQPFGINFAIFTLCCLAAGFVVLWVGKQYPARGTLWLIPIILLFAAVTFVRAEPMTVFLGVVFTLLLLAVLANTFLGGKWFLYGLPDYAAGLLGLIGSIIARPLSFSAQLRAEETKDAGTRKKTSVWPYVRGIVIALPILAVFAALLASADAVFSSELDTLLKFLAIENLPQYIFRLAYILAGAYALAGVILHAASQSKDEKIAGERKPFVDPFLGFIEATVVLGGVALLFAAFVVVQFRYFFGGQANINVAGFTYAEYARRGFGELVIVAFFSLLLILGLGGITGRQNSLQRRVFSGLSVAIVVLVMVMLVSAYQRLVLYETAYGFSRLRTYTHVALVWIGLLLATVVILEIFRQERTFAFAALLACLGFAISLAVVNVDDLIVQENVRRAMQGQELDVPYLVSLSTDSVPALVEAYQRPATPAAVRDEIGAALFCRLQRNTEPAQLGWRSFTFSRSWADTSFQRIAGRLSGYRVIDESWPMQITTPAGATHQCYSSGMD